MPFVHILVRLRPSMFILGMVLGYLIWNKKKARESKSKIIIKNGSRRYTSKFAI
jgi:hypothetical protein